MIKSFKHKGLEKCYTTGDLRGIQAIHANKLSRILIVLNRLESLEDLSSPAYKLHRLKGNLKDLWSVTVQANWRITFRYDNSTNDVYIVDYQDYH